MPEALEERIGMDAMRAETAQDDEAIDSMLPDGAMPEDGEFPVVDAAEEERRQAEEREACKGLTLEQRCERIEQAILRQSLHREIHCKVLAFCRQRRALNEIESQIQTYPEFKHATQDPCHLILAMVEAGGLQEFELDRNGGEVTPAMKEGLDEDAIDDLVAGWAYETTGAGNLIVSRHTPQARLAELLEAEPRRRNVYIQVMEYLEESPRTYAQVGDLLSQSGALTPFCLDEVGMQPSVFLDKLERAGGIVWDEVWLLTEGGGGFLKDLELSNRGEK